MVTDFLNWSVSVFKTVLSWLSQMQIVSGVSLLGFLGAVFAIGLLLSAVLFKGGN